MDYQLHYDAIISRAQRRVLTGYFEIHHIIPRSLGGTDDASNLVNLTAREHYVVHQLLVKIYPTIRFLAVAAMLMATRCSGSRAYEWLRKRHAANLTGRTHTAEHNAKIAAGGMGKKRSPATGIKIGDVNRKRKYSEATLDKMSRSAVRFTPEHIKQIFALRADGWSQQKIADKLGMSQAMVSLLLRGKSRNSPNFNPT